MMIADFFQMGHTSFYKMMHALIARALAIFI